MLDVHPARRLFAVLVVVATATLASASAAHADAPYFSKAFDPATIGPGNVSTLTFTISTMGEDFPAPAQDLAFSDSLPPGVTIATPAAATSTCGGTVSAPDGGTTIAFSGGSVGVPAECLVTVNVTSSVAGTRTNVSGNLTSDQGDSGTATADLTVSAGRPAFSKSFAPATVAVGHVSRLTFTIDDSAIGSKVTRLSFSDYLPPGLVLASPVNLVNTCSSSVTAVSGTGFVRMFAGVLLANSSCSVSVDVVPTVGGTFDNVTGTLGSSKGDAGKASAILSVPVGFLNKTFIDDPVAPGGTVTLELSMVNLDRSNPATGITFTDDLDAALTGLVATGLPASDVCGAGSSLSGTSVLTFSGASLGPGERCTFDVTLQVPTGATAGAYTNTTSSVSADLGGSPVVYPPASDDLLVAPVPILTKTFVDNPTLPGSAVTLELSITNSDPASSMTAIGFSDDLSAFMSGLTTGSIHVPASGFCGGGSTAIVSSTGFPSGGAGIYLSGASLAAGATCTFDVTIDLPADVLPGTYTNTTSFVDATVGGMPLAGKPATDSLVVVGPPRLTKSFLGPALPGDTATLQLTLTYGPNAPAAASDISFTDDLGAALPGLVAIGLPASDLCGAGSSLSGTNVLTFSGGSLDPGASCTFDVTLQVPAAAVPGTYTNTTSTVSATSDGLPVTGAAASAKLLVSVLSLTKSFTDDPVVRGGTVHLQFTLGNASPTASVTNAAFTDDLGAALSGLAPTGLPMADVCGAGSTLSAAGSVLTLTGGTLAPGASCVFSVPVTVPAAAAPGEYVNKTSSVSADVDGNPVTAPPASDTLTVELPLSISKKFLQNPVVSGSTVTLELVISNADPSKAATGLAFTDDLDAALGGLVATGTPMSDVCGAGSTLSGTSVLTLAGGNLPAGGSCTFDVTLQVPAGVAAGTLAHNVTSDLTGTVGGVASSAPPATDTLAVQSLAFSKSFDAPTGPGGTAVLSFTIQNLSSTTGTSDLSFVDDLNAVLPGLVAVGLPVSDVCGAGSQLSGTSLLTFTSGNLDPSGSCTFSVTVQVPGAAAPGSYTNTTSNLSAGGLMAAAPATAALQVEPLPGLTKAFTPGSITQEQTSTLTFTIDNSGSGAAASGLDFTDALPSGMVVASPAQASTTCTGGAITASPGSTTVAYSGGTVGAGAMCSVQVNVTATGSGNLVNTSGALTSAFGTGGTAASTLVVAPSALVIPTLDPRALALLAALLLGAAAWRLRG